MKFPGLHKPFMTMFLVYGFYLTFIHYVIMCTCVIAERLFNKDKRGSEQWRKVELRLFPQKSDFCSFINIDVPQNYEIYFPQKYDFSPNFSSPTFLKFLKKTQHSSSKVWSHENSDFSFENLFLSLNLLLYLHKIDIFLKIWIFFLSEYWQSVMTLS